jgi:hypothetical protein
MHSQDVRFELEHGVPIVLITAVVLKEFTDTQIVGCVANDAIVIVELEEKQVTIVKKDPLILHTHTVIVLKLESGIVPGLFLELPQSLVYALNNRIEAKRARPVGAPVEFILLNAKGLTDLEYLAPVFTLDKTRAVLRVVGPVVQNPADVLTHISPSTYNIVQEMACGDESCNWPGFASTITAR